MASGIDISIPPFGNATTAGVRANFTTAKAEIEALQTQIGYVDYNDTATTSTPISVSPSTWTKLTNNKLGVYGQERLPDGITNLWNAVTNQFAFSECPVYTMLEFRSDVEVTTSGANQVVKFDLSLAIGDPGAFSLPSNEIYFKTSGARRVVTSIPFCIGSTSVKNNPGEVRIWSDASCTVKVLGWYIRVIKHLGV